MNENIKINNMIVKIDSIQLSTELAKQRLNEEWGNLYPYEQVTKEIEGKYVKEALDIFTEHYEYYLKIITNLTIKDDS